MDGLPVGGLTAEEAGRVLTDLAKAKDIPAVSAGFDPANGEVIPERLGRRLNVAASINELLTAPAGSSLLAEYEPFMPEITRNTLVRAKELGAYTSPILDSSPNYLQNIRLAAKLINNSILVPGQEFSFNRITGELTADRGRQGLDGICQVSSTLYNAVLAANLKVTEHPAYFPPFADVPQGKDATTYRDKDFKFVNESRWQLIIRSFTDSPGTRLTVDLWALPDA